MTYKELYLKEHPECEDFSKICDIDCPGDLYDSGSHPCNDTCPFPNNCGENECRACWDQEIPEETEGFKSEELVPIGEEVAKGFEKGILEPKTSVNFDGAEFQKKVYEALGIPEKTVDKVNAIGFPYPVSPKEIADGMIANKSNAAKRSDIQKTVEKLRSCGFKEAGEAASEAQEAWERLLDKQGDLFKDAADERMKLDKENLEEIDNDILKEMIKSTEKDTSSIKDSGTRREFSTGAVRDIQEGKGRCDLMPLDVVGHLLFDDPFIFQVHEFTKDGDPEHLICALAVAAHGNGYPWDRLADMLLDVSMHFEAGAKKYGEHNWRRGIPTKCYIDSAVRHYLKMCRGDKDEAHDRAFVWNILCCIWTCKHKPELNDYPRKEKVDV